MISPRSRGSSGQEQTVGRPFYASGNVATAGGCLSGQYLAAWIITRLADADTARRALSYVAPVGEKDEYVDRALGHVLAFTSPIESSKFYFPRAGLRPCRDRGHRT
jgi:hypothetical protein